MPTVKPPSPPPRTVSPPAQPRLLSGAGGGRSGGTRTAGTKSATEATTFTATVPFKRPQAQTQAIPAAAAPAAVLPRWAKGVVIGGVLLAVGMPVTVLMSRSMLVQEALTEQSSSKAAMVCTGGEGRAVDSSSLTGWLFGGSYFSCGDWETREARQQRDRDRDQANYLAREKARQQYQ